MGLSDGNRFLGSKVRAATIVTPIFNEAIQLAEIATPSTPAAGFVKVYAKDDRIFILDENGRETMLEVPLDTIDTKIVDASLVTSGVWYTVIAAISGLGRKVQIFDTTGNPISWSIDAVPVSPKFLSGAGTNETLEVEIPAGSKLSMKIDEAGPFVGNVLVNIMG